MDSTSFVEGTLGTCCQALKASAMRILFAMRQWAGLTNLGESSY
jgi:hypothetical protein